MLKKYIIINIKAVNFIKIKIFNEKCEETIKKMIKFNHKVDIILTSPPYNTGRPSNSERSRNNNEGRYDIHIDNLSAKEYRKWCVALFNSFDNILSENGIILWQVSYGNDATINTESIGLIWGVLSDIIDNTNFTIADRIVWKKKTALPNNTSSNKLTRITEDVYVFCRKSEIKTFNANKPISKVGKNGQTFYKNIFNYIEAPNNDEKCDLNKATYSSNLCEQLLHIYAKEKAIIYDPFIGTGTTAVACKKLGLNCFGSEISEAQCNYAIERIKKTEVLN